MNIEELQTIILSYPAVTEDVKWQNDLCFSVGTKMFAVIGLHQSPTTATFKVPEEEFEVFSQREGFKPAPYLARYNWVYVDDLNRMTKKEWEHYTRQSYELVKLKLSPKLKKQFNLL